MPCGINPSFNGLSPWDGQVAHALRTRAPLSPWIASYQWIPSDLHVLGLPLAFILSQDQTLHCKMKFLIPTIYNNQNSFFISLILDRIEQFLNLFMTFVCLLVTLHDCVFLKNFVASTSVSAVFRWALGPSLSFLFSPPFPLGLQR